MARAFLRRGRPFPGQQVAGPRPALILDLLEEGALRQIRRAGDAGVALGHGLALSTAIRLALLGHVVIDPGAPQIARRAAPHRRLAA